MAYDEGRQRMVMFGGAADTTSGLDEVWEWDGIDWHRATPSTGLPPARTAAAMAYDTARTTAVMFGGVADDGVRPLDDTWVWNGASWRAAESTNAPPPRSEHAMAFDSARGRTVLFGGIGTSDSLRDTWEWDGARWLETTSTTRPPARRGHVLVYDTARSRTLLIGGMGDGAFPQLSDQWAWDGTRWTDVTPDRIPPWRMDFAAAFDSERGKLVMFGGHTASALLADVWEWDGIAWTDQTSTSGSSPAARFGHALAYDTARQLVVLVGGQGNSGSLNDVWEWNGMTWTSVSPGASLPARHRHAMVYDAARETLVMFGGEDATSTAMRDTAFLHYDDQLSSGEVCDTGLDRDADGKTGCEDPDCSGLCAQCGDGVCDGFESCRLCPEDCGVCFECGDLQCEPGESCASCPGDCGPCHDP
jgi:hypothetical protein